MWRRVLPDPRRQVAKQGYLIAAVQPFLNQAFEGLPLNRDIRRSQIGFDKIGEHAIKSALVFPLLYEIGYR